MQRVCRWVLIVFLGMVLVGVGAEASSSASRMSGLNGRGVHWARVVVPFVENRGQVDKDVSLYAKTLGGTVFLTRDGEIAYYLAGSHTGDGSVVFKERVVGSSPVVRGKVPCAARVNIFKGRDSSKWLKGLHTYTVATLGEVRKGVSLDLRAYGKRVEKVFTFAPHTDLSSLWMVVKGASSLSVDGEGRLVVNVFGDTYYFTRPVAYQPLDSGGRIFVDARYRVNGDRYSFEVGRYDHSKPIVIDPLLASTFLGGSSDDKAFDVTLDNGRVYVTGTTTSTDFPTTAGTYCDTNAGGSDVFVSVFNQDLSALLNSTYIGGSGMDNGSAIAVNASGVYITGFTNSTDFPTTAGTYCDTNAGGYDAFVSVLDTNLANLVYSTYIGGSRDDFAEDIALGSVYITGYTNSSDFPTTDGSSLSGSYDVFVSKFNDTLALQNSTLWGSTGEDKGESIVTDGTNVFVGGYYYDSGGGVYHGFIHRRDLDLTNLVKSYLQNSNSYISGITLDSSKVYATGLDGDNVLVGSVDKNYSVDGTPITESTFGGSGSDYGRSIFVLGSNLYVTGSTNSSDFPASGGFYDDSYNGADYDAFVAKVNPGSIGGGLNQGQDLNATFLGGTNTDEGMGISVNATGAYVAGYTFSSNFPASAGANDTSYNNNGDAFVSLLDSDLHGYTLTANALGLAGSGNLTMDNLTAAGHSLSGNIHSVTAVGSWNDVYSKDTQVPLTAVPLDERYKFDGWSGDCSGNSPSVTVSTDADKTCNASFSLKQADLGVTKGVDKTLAYVGDTLTYTITVTNNGPDCASGVVVTDTLPNGLTVTGCSTTAGSCSLVSATTLNCTLGTIDNGTSNTATVHVTAVVSCPFGGSCSTITNTATVDSTSNDTDSSNNTASNSTNILANLKVDKGGDCATCYNAAVIFGDVNGTDGNPINCGSDCDDDYNATTQVNLGFSGLPEYCHFVHWNCTSCAGSSIDTSASHSITMRGNSTCNATFDMNHADLSVNKSGNSTVAVGQTVTYTITVTNNGPDCATGVWMSDALPAQLTFDCATASNGGCCTNSGGNVDCDLGNLTNGEKVTITLTATAPSSTATVTNNATANSTSEDDNLTNNRDNFTTEVQGMLLTVTTSGDGGGTITSNPPGIDCGADCQERYGLNQVVTLTATDGPTAYFDHWEGDCSGSTLSTTVTMDSDKTCTAVFRAIEHPASPKNFKASVTPCEGPGTNAKVVLTWDEVTKHALGYIIYDADSGAMLAWIQSASTTTYTLYSLHCGEVYHLAIKTRGGTVNSNMSSPIAVEIPPCDQCQSGGSSNPPSSPSSMEVVWPIDNSNINYDDFAAEDGLAVFAWRPVKGAVSYKIYLALDDGSGAKGGEFTPKKGNSPGELIVVEDADLAGIYFELSKDAWNSLTNYTVLWKVTALDGSGNTLAETKEMSFGLNSAE